MSYFECDVIYIIVPTASVTEDMINLMKINYYVSGDSSTNSLRKNNDSSKTLFKLKKYTIIGTTTFLPYKWYNMQDILVEMQEAEWVA